MGTFLKKPKWLCGFWAADLGTGLLCYILGGCPVLLGLLFGLQFVSESGLDSSRPSTEIISTACCRGDGIYYADIASHGYSYNPNERSSVAYFPVYPLAARFLSSLTLLETRPALLVVSNLMLLGVFVLLSAYLRIRLPNDDRDRRRYLILSCFAVWPSTLFFRMAYTESTFILFTLVFLYGLSRKWPVLILAFLAGITSAIRPVGLGRCRDWR